MAILVLGGMLVGALVVWALTRTVEPASVMTGTETSAPVTAAPGSTRPNPPATGTSPSAPGTVAGAQTPTPPPGPQGDPTSVQRIAVEDLRAKVNRNEVTVLDVREAVAFNAGHIPGSLNIPMASIEANIDTIPKDKLIVTYCT